ncbi:MAG: AraC family transcriptional regulator [Actinocatenispora sp.]
MSWAGTVQLKPGRMVYYGTISEVPIHSSVAIGLILAVSGRIDLLDDAGRCAALTATGPRAAILPPGEPHSALGLRAGEPTEPAEALLAVLDPQTPAGQLLTARLHRAGTEYEGPDGWIAAAAPCSPLVHRPGADDPGGSELLDTALRALADTDPPDPPTLHPGLRRAVELIPDRLSRGVRLSGLAAEVGLSTSRLGHLFTVELGLPYRAYVRWARLQKVVDALRDGATLGVAAHAAGFTDSAHMNRACRQMFGINPSEFIRDMRWL